MQLTLISSVPYPIPASTTPGDLPTFIEHVTTTRSPMDAIDALVKWWKREMIDSDYALGWSVAAVPANIESLDVAVDQLKRLHATLD